MKSYCTLCDTYTPNGIAGEIHTEGCPTLKTKTIAATDVAGIRKTPKLSTWTCPECGEVTPNYFDGAGTLHRGKCRGPRPATQCAFCYRTEGHSDSCPAATGTRAFTQALAEAQITQEKPSNPKDALGISKAPMSTVSAVVLAEVGVAMLEGAAKYGRHNYRAVGVRSSVYYDATMRHLMAWWEGQDIDPGSGMHHVTKAITSLIVLRDAMLFNNAEDDRPPRCPDFYETLNAKAAEILRHHADKHPRHYTWREVTYAGTGLVSEPPTVAGCDADRVDPRPGR